MCGVRPKGWGYRPGTIEGQIPASCSPDHAAQFATFLVLRDIAVQLVQQTSMLRAKMQGGKPLNIADLTRKA